MRRRDLDGRSVDQSAVLCTSVREGVHRPFSNVEFLPGRVDHSDRHRRRPPTRLRGVRQVPARPTLWRVPPRDDRRAADERERREVAELVVPARHQPVFAVRARDAHHGRVGRVVDRVVRDGRCEGGDDAEGEGGELHDA